MNSVITLEQAKKITGGRRPLVPVEYEAAIKALAECCTLDESKYWSDKADALAAWAKIYRDDEAARKAKILKLHAYRRMGQLAGELRPPNIGNKRGVGMEPGPLSLLKEHGLSREQATASRHLAKIPSCRFELLAKNPVSPTTAHVRLLYEGSPWREIQSSAMNLRSRLRQYPPKQVVIAMNSTEAATAHKLFLEIAEWLDEFERHLPKPSAK